MDVITSRSRRYVMGIGDQALLEPWIASEEVGLQGHSKPPAHGVCPASFCFTMPAVHSLFSVQDEWNRRWLFRKRFTRRGRRFGEAMQICIRVLSGTLEPRKAAR